MIGILGRIGGNSASFVKEGALPRPVFLAEKDGLCVDKFDLEDVPRCSTSITNFGEQEIQWQFKHDTIAVAQ